MEHCWALQQQYVGVLPVQLPMDKDLSTLFAVQRAFLPDVQAAVAVFATLATAEALQPHSVWQLCRLLLPHDVSDTELRTCCKYLLPAADYCMRWGNSPEAPKPNV